MENSVNNTEKCESFENYMKNWNRWRNPPKEALKPIKGGRLNNFTDISPIWRLQMLTETYGPCGLGWKYEIVSTDYITGHGGEITVVVGINLYYKTGENWSAPIPGVGSAKYVTSERTGMYNDDEAIKKAMTDAISVSCKALGIGADIYWADGSKYTTTATASSLFVCTDCGCSIEEHPDKTGETMIASDISGYTKIAFGRRLCYDCLKRASERRKAEKAAQAAKTEQATPAGDSSPTA